MAILKQQQSGQTVVQIAREHGISEATFYNWNRNAGAAEVRRHGSFRLKRLKDLKGENRRLKKMYAEPSLDHKIVTVGRCHRACSTASVGTVKAKAYSQQRACRLAGLSRRMLTYQSKRQPNIEVEQALQTVARRHPE